MMRGTVARTGKLLSILILAFAAPLQAQTRAGPPLGATAWLGMIVLIALLVASIIAYHVVADPRRRRRAPEDGEGMGQGTGPGTREAHK